MGSGDPILPPGVIAADFFCDELDECKVVADGRKHHYIGFTFKLEQVIQNYTISTIAAIICYYGIQLNKKFRTGKAGLAIVIFCAVAAVTASEKYGNSKIYTIGHFDYDKLMGDTWTFWHRGGGGPGWHASPWALDEYNDSPVHILTW